MSPKRRSFIGREELLKRSIAYALTVVGLTVLVTFLILSSQDFINEFANFQTQIIIVAGAVLILALFVQYRQTAESTANANLHSGLEAAHQALAEKSREITKKQEQIERDLRTALMVQQAIINRYQPDVPKLKIATRSVPATNVGGDFFEFISPNKDNNRLDIVIGDVAGHGVPSSLITILSLVLLEEIAKEEKIPAIILLRANTVIEGYINNTVVPFVTAFYASLDTDTGLLQYARAGHPPPLLKRGGQWQELEARGVFLGTFSDNTYEERKTNLLPGDILVFYTDGLTETKDPEENMFGVERLQQAIDNAQDNEPQTIIDNVMREIDIYSDGHQDDDRTMIVLAFE
ncbi:PP2C family protein-serine/threonine phosphatase [Candidatus Margulisiibacteriota bacterium]